MAKQMASLYPGFCRACRQNFAAGTQILWEKGAGSTHVVCPTATTSTTPAAAAPAAKTSKPAARPDVDLESAPFVIWEKWEPSKRVFFEARLKSAIGQARRFALGPATRKVRGKAAQARFLFDPCTVCGAAANVRCSPPEGAITRETTYADHAKPMPPGGWPRGLVCVAPATSDTQVPVPEEDRRRTLPKLREGASGAAEPGVYVVVGAGKWTFQTAEDNDDMGDRQGANWSGPLYLRRATAEETAAEERQILGEAMGDIFTAMAGMVARGVKRRAYEEMDAAKLRPGYVRVTVTHVGALPEEMREARKKASRLWEGNNSYVETYTVGGAQIFESYLYIYDFDQPIVLVGPESIVGTMECRDKDKAA